MKRGTGYTPSKATVYYRAVIRGPIKQAQGNLAVQLPGGDNPPGVNPTVDAAFMAAWKGRYGIELNDAKGGWAYGPGNERAGLAAIALEFFFPENPGFIGSPGAAGGYDGVATYQEAVDVGAFGDERIITAWSALREDDEEAPVPPPPPPVEPPAPPIPPTPPRRLPPRPSARVLETARLAPGWLSKSTRKKRPVQVARLQEVYIYLDELDTYLADAEAEENR